MDQDNNLRSLSVEHEAEGVHELSAFTDRRPSTRRSISDVWIYKRTTRWLRDLLNHAKPYSSKLTQLPDKGDRLEGPGRVRGHTMSFLGGVHPCDRKDAVTSRDLTRYSTVKTSYTVDNRYRTTFNDLENILNSAVQLAKEAVEQFDYRPIENSNHGSMYESRVLESESGDEELRGTHGGYVSSFHLSISNTFHNL